MMSKGNVIRCLLSHLQLPHSISLRNKWCSTLPSYLPPHTLCPLTATYTCICVMYWCLPNTQSRALINTDLLVNSISGHDFSHLHNLCTHKRHLSFTFIPPSTSALLPVNGKTRGLMWLQLFKHWFVVMACEPTTLGNNDHTCEKKQVFYGSMENRDVYYKEMF